MSKLIGGSASLFIDGSVYSSEGSFDANINNIKREPVVSAEGQVYYTEEPVVSSISGDIFMTDKLDADTVVNMTEGTVMVVLRTGKTVMLSQAFYDGDGDVNVKEGTLSVSFSGVGRFV